MFRPPYETLYLKGETFRMFWLQFKSMKYVVILINVVMAINKLHLLISRKGKHKQQQARNPP